MKTQGVRHIFIIGSKSIGQYGGYETFVDRLIKEHENDMTIKYHVACKANGEGCMKESELEGVRVIKRDRDWNVEEFEYRNAHVYKIKCPNIGPAVAIYYDYMAARFSIDYCKRNRINNPIFYVLTCRIGVLIKGIKKQITKLGGKYYVNPDGHEWMRTKWSKPVRQYWKWSEGKMVCCADMVVCDSINIENYIQSEYKISNTRYIAYGADVTPSILSDDNTEAKEWFEKKGLTPGGYYLIVGRFVPENNFETMIREFMSCHSDKDLAIITNTNIELQHHLEDMLHYTFDSRVKFVGTVYNQQLLKKIREHAYGYIHGHEVGGTNPSLLEALSSTQLNLLLDVGFNREVGLDAALYWSKETGNLARLIETADNMDTELVTDYGNRAKLRITDCYSWKHIGDEYKNLWDDSIQ